jgi:hypothetical protein
MAGSEVFNLFMIVQVKAKHVANLIIDLVWRERKNG